MGPTLQRGEDTHVDWWRATCDLMPRNGNSCREVLKNLNQFGFMWQLQGETVGAVRMLLDGLRPESTVLLSEALHTLHIWAVMVIRRWEQLSPVVHVHVWRCREMIKDTQQKLNALSSVKVVHKRSLEE